MGKLLRGRIIRVHCERKRKEKRRSTSERGGDKGEGGGFVTEIEQPSGPGRKKPKETKERGVFYPRWKTRRLLEGEYLFRGGKNGLRTAEGV